MNIIDLVNVLRKKGIVVNEFENIGMNYRKKWMNAFSDSQLEQHQDLNEFLWYLFSSEKVGYLEKKKATLSFNKVNKQYCYIFFQESEDVLQVEYASSMNAKICRM